MATLTTIIPDARFLPIANPIANNLTQLHIYNTNTRTQNNGGQCCCWIVPANVLWAKFEMWGGGGAGAGACCCMQPNPSAGSSPYARRTLKVTPGEFYNVCAASSTCCISWCGGAPGYPSFACGGTNGTVLALCVSGGCNGIAQCFQGYGDCRGCGTCITGQVSGHDFAMCGLTGSVHSTNCGYDSWTYWPQPTYIGGGQLMSRDYCLQQSGADADWTSVFPGGGSRGGVGVLGDVINCGTAGAGGLVIITYK